MIKFYSPKGSFFSFETSCEKQTAPHHYHNCFEFYFLMEGMCHYFINNKTYNLVADDIVIVPKGVIHKTTYNNTPHRRNLICCSSHYLPMSAIDFLATMPKVYRNSSLVLSVRSYLKEIEHEYYNSLPYREEIIRNLFQNLLLTLVRSDSSTPVSNTNAQISEIVLYMKKNYKNHCSLDQVATAFSITSEYLSRLFKKETGMLFSEYRTMLRLREAETMLINQPGISIIDVAQASGFNDSNYFSQVFKEFYGVSPSKFRKS